MFVARDDLYSVSHEGWLGQYAKSGPIKRWKVGWDCVVGWKNIYPCQYSHNIKWINKNGAPNYVTMMCETTINFCFHYKIIGLKYNSG